MVERTQMNDSTLMLVRGDDKLAKEQFVTMDVLILFFLAKGFLQYYREFGGEKCLVIS